MTIVLAKRTASLENHLLLDKEGPQPKIIDHEEQQKAYANSKPIN